MSIKRKVTVAIAVAAVIILVGTSIDAWAKKSSSRSSTKSSSFSFSSKKVTTPKPAPSKTSYTSKPKTQATPTKTQPTQSAPVKKVATVQSSSTKTVVQRIDTKQKVATSKVAYQQQRQMFKKQPIAPSTNSANTVAKTTTKSSTSYDRSNPIIYRTRTVNRTTYIDRRGRYYNSWEAPTYVYSGYPSYGMWDSLALWYMLDNINDAHYRDMYYHHMNTPGMASWRKEAEELAKDNAELKAKLNALDVSVKDLETQGIRRDQSYLPPGVDADILLSAEVLEDTKPVIKMCTGAKDRNYYNVAKIIGRDIASARIEPIVTAGSADNLERLENGSCDAAIVQRDAYWNHVDINPASKLDFTRIMSPYSEVVHLVCNRQSGVEKLSDLNSKHTILIGESGSGSEVTWKNVVAENERYATVRIENVDGAIAKTRVASGDADCLLSVSGLKTQFMTDINRLAGTTKLDLVEWDDFDILSLNDPAGNAVYTQYQLAANTYSNLQMDNWTHRISVDTDTVIVPADVIVSNKWIAQNKQQFETFTSEAINRISLIQNYAGAQ